MSSRVGIARIRQYFREANLDEAEVVLTLINKDVASRLQEGRQPALPFTRKTRKPRAKKVDNQIAAQAEAAAVAAQ